MLVRLKKAFTNLAWAVSLLTRPGREPLCQPTSVKANCLWGDWVDEAVVTPGPAGPRTKRKAESSMIATKATAKRANLERNSAPALLFQT
jgi:hypothetical protein